MTDGGLITRLSPCTGLLPRWSGNHAERGGLRVARTPRYRSRIADMDWWRRCTLTQC